MNISPPSPEVLARLLDEHAGRFPEKATIGPLGRQRVRLPILLANPKPDSPALNDAIAVALNLRPNDDPAGTELARACVLWPRTEWAGWRAKWPAIDNKVGTIVAKKIGAALSVLEVPDEDAEPPEGIAPSEEGVWRTLRPNGTAIHVAIDPPAESVWRMFLADVVKPGAPVARRAQELALSCVKGSTMPIEDAFARWPGLVVAVIAVINELAGNSAEAALGNW